MAAKGWALCLALYKLPQRISMKIGIDTGFGHTKYCFKGKNDKMMLKKFPSVVAICPDDIESDENVAILDGKPYYVSSLALNSDPRHIKEVTSYQDLETYAPLFIHELCIKEGLKPEDVDEICVGLAPAHKNNAQKFKERLESFEISGLQYNQKVSVIPQGVGAVKALQDFWSDKNAEPENYIVVDIGFNTLDIVLVFEGEIQKSRLNQSNSFEKKGVVLIAEEMQKYIKQHHNRNITSKEALKIIIEESYKLRGDVFDLSSFVSELKTSYTKDIMDFLESRYSNEIDKLDAFVFVGGGGYFVNKNYTSHTMTFKNSEYYNAIGNLLTISPKAK